MPTRGEIDRLGDLLRREFGAGSDLAHNALVGYEAYRVSAAPALESVVTSLETMFPAVQIASRMKTPDSVTAKLRRTPQMRLSRMQDVAGCRFVVASLADQDQAVTRMGAVFADAKVDDMRTSPHSGYRAIHVIVTAESGVPVEIQVRTSLQQQWAEMSEKVAYAVGMEVKYGGGPEAVRAMLDEMSDEAWALDRLKVATGTSESLETAERRFVSRCAAIIALTEGAR